MNTTRQDAWTKDEDTLLAETVLSYIREGKTQLEAFKEVAKRLSRTSAACGFRWNASVRKKYDHAIQFAKQERKNRRITSDWERKHVEEQKVETDPLDTAISLLKRMQGNTPLSKSLQAQETEIALGHLESENKQLKVQLQRYEDAWQEMFKLWKWVQNNDRSE